MWKQIFDGNRFNGTLKRIHGSVDMVFKLINHHYIFNSCFYQKIIKIPLIENNLNGRRPQREMTSTEDDINGRQPQYKTTSIEEVDLNGRQPK